MKGGAWEGRLASVGMIGAVCLAIGLLHGKPVAMPEPVRELGSVLALAFALGWWSRRRSVATAVASAGRRMTFWDSAVVGVGVIALEGAMLAVLVFTPDPMESVVGKWDGFGRAETAETGENPTPEPPARSGNWLWDEAKERELPTRARLKPANRPEVFLQATGDEGPLLRKRLYLQAFTLGSYEAGVWSAIPTGTGRLQAENDGWLRMGDEVAGLPHRVFLGSTQSARQPLVALQGLQAVKVAELGRGDGMLTLPGGEGINYQAVSQPRTLDDPGPRVAKLDPPAAGELLRVPGGAMGESIRGLAREMAGDGAPDVRLKRLRDGLGQRSTYSLSIDNPEGRDPLENFLFHERRGHCEFFATAGALLARSIGVPARVTYGWAGGTYYESGKWFVFRSRDAHAWTEVWLENHGWVVMDATPPQAVGGGRPELADAGAEAPITAEEGSEQTTFLAADGRMAVGGAVGVLALFVGVLIGRRCRVSAMLSGGSLLESAVAYEREFRRGCARRGVLVAAGSTLRVLVAALGDARPDFTAEMIEYHYGFRYEGRARDPEREKLLRAKARRWAEE